MLVPSAKAIIVFDSKKPPAGGSESKDKTNLDGITYCDPVKCPSNPDCKGESCWYMLYAG